MYHSLVSRVYLCSDPLLDSRRDAGHHLRTMIAPVPPPCLKPLDAFYLEHRMCDELESDLEEQADGAALVWLAYEACGARIVRGA